VLCVYLRLAVSDSCAFLVAAAVKLCMFASCCAACCVLVDRYCSSV
jgi:hypothetical protein